MPTSHASCQCSLARHYLIVRVSVFINFQTGLKQFTTGTLPQYKYRDHRQSIALDKFWIGS
jgi:hypothetical protein